MARDHALAIGVDGGASGVRALAIRALDDGSLVAAGERAERRHAPFEPLPPAARAGAPAAHTPRPGALGASEREAAAERVRATADAIVEAAAGARGVVLALCWPGIKSADGRGVIAARHAPRDPGLLDALERELAARGLELARPIPPLKSDGVAGALGEVHAAQGALRGARCALYLAGGTGLAEAVLLDGRVRAPDELVPPLLKAWEMARGDATFEDVLSPGGWERRARAGARDARADVADALVEYLLDRSARLGADHRARPERAVIGARLGLFLAAAGDGRRAAADEGQHAAASDGGHSAASDGRRAAASPAGTVAGGSGTDPCAALERALAAAGLPPGFVRPSTFRDAPCFGAAALALGRGEAACPS
jgi:hypothetical protein